MMDIIVALDSKVVRTSKGTPYLTTPGVAMIASSMDELSNMQEFLDGFDHSLEFTSYNSDLNLHPAEAIVKVAGQLCYLSFGPDRSKTSDAQRYFDNIKMQAHGSVLEHASSTLLIYGISRSVTHEVVRHRAGMAYSQVSQRYVDGKTLRFVERPEFQKSSELHDTFCNRIDVASTEYARIANELIISMKDQLSDISKRDARKAVNQSARAILPNETEAPIIITGNMRAWRHFIEMRCSRHADSEIRILAGKIFTILHSNHKMLFSDYVKQDLPDGTFEVTTPWKKV